MMPAPTSKTRSRSHTPRTDALKHWVQNRAAGLVLAAAALLPYRWRIPAMGWLATHVLSQLAGMRARIRDNLAHVRPDLLPAEVARLSRAVPDNMGRAMAEIFSGQEFVARAAGSPIEGEGLAALERAHASGQPVVLVTGHFGNYDAARVALAARGFRLAGLYMPMTNLDFNRRYVAAISAIGAPVFPRSRQGLAGAVRFLRGGGMLGLLVDHYMSHGVLIDFMGKPARTALSAAEIGLKYNALVVPVYGIRQPDGLNFVVRVEAPIPHGDPVDMTRALNSSLEKLVERHMDQWMWTHRRWKRATLDAENQPPQP